MAEKFFRLAAEAGHTPSRFYAALMLIEMGNKELAAQELQELRGSYPDLWDECSKELAMLRYAYGHTLYASGDWDLSTLSRSERVRMGRYADSIGQFVKCPGYISRTDRNRLHGCHTLSGDGQDLSNIQ